MPGLHAALRHCQLRPHGRTLRSGARWICVVVDDFSRYIWIFFMKNQSEFHENITALHRELQATLINEHPVAVLHSDAGTYFEKDARVIESDLCTRTGMRQTFSPPATPALNSIDERNLRTLCESARAMMIACNAP